MIVILRTHWVLGGAERYLADISAALTELGYEVFLGTLSEPPRSDVRSALLQRSRAVGFQRWALNRVEIERRSSMCEFFVNAVPSLVVSPRGQRNWLVVFTPGVAGPSRISARLRWKAGIALRRSLRIMSARGLELGAGRRFTFYGYHAPRHAVREYERLIAISEFVARGVAAYWRCGADIVYPAVRIPNLVEIPKARGTTIVSIGRFLPGGNMKHHAALIEAFRRLSARQTGWKLVLIGGFEGSPAEVDYLSALRRSASGLAVEFMPNATDVETATILSSSSFLWHAAGCSAGPEEYLNVEQFGIAVAEAAAYGVVPLVYPAGGVCEIVPTFDGYTWRRPDDLVDETLRTFHTPGCWERKSEAARAAARRFSFARLRDDVRDLIFRAPVRPSVVSASGRQ